MRALLLALVLVLSGLPSCVRAWADEGEGDATVRLAQVRRDLKSASPTAVAHAAFAASEEGLGELVPDLVRELASRPDPEGHEAWLVVRHILDALIRLDAKVPMEILRAYEDHIQTSVLILAVRNGKEAFPLLRKTLSRSVSGDKMRAAGVAAGNLLATAKDRTVAPSSLGLIRTTLSITVVDHDRMDLGTGTVGMFGHGDGLCTVPESFPPSVWYELTFRGSERRWSRQLARGPVKDVWYERWVDRRKKFIWGDLSGKARGDEIARGWLASLLDLAVGDLPLRRRYYGHHNWKDGPTYLAYVQTKFSEIERAVSELVGRLIAAGALTAAQGGKVRIEPDVRVRDARDNKQVPLPELRTPAR